MLIRVLTVATLVAITGCASLGMNENAAKQGPVIARAFFSDEACRSDPSRGEAESALGAAALSWLIGKAAEGAVNFVAGAIADAAKADRETFTVTGQSADYLFKVQGDKATARGCLYVVVAPRVKGGKWCELGQKGHWYNAERCIATKEVAARWREWSLGTPTFFAEIGMTRPEGGPPGAVIPRAFKVYYPEPISTMDTDKVQGFTITVTATKPTKSTKTTGDVVLEVFLGGDGVTPKTVASDAALHTSGLWVVVPGVEGGVGSSFAGPVNLTVTVAETPHPTKWLQAVAKYVDENKQKAIDKIVAKTDSSKREAAEEAEAVDALKMQGTAATACVAFSTQMEKLSKASKAAGTGSTEEEKLRSGYALDEACSATKLLKRTTQAAWEASGKSSGILCDRAKDPDVEIGVLCTH